MASLPPAPVVLPMWRGRRGLVAAALCFVLAIGCGMGLLLLVERSTIAPACRGYAAAHEMRYVDFKLVGVKRNSTVVCLLARPDGTSHDVYLRELVSTFTDLWVGILVSLEFTVPALAILLALARVALYRLAGSKGADPAGAE
jgi:hypothetical protein